VAHPLLILRMQIPIRNVHIVLSLLMLSFMAVQWNDPDGILWMIIYAVPMLWTAIAAFAPERLMRPSTRRLLAGFFLGALVATIYFWPKTPHWWTGDVWKTVETAREGMGMMIVAMVLLAVFLTGNARKRSGEYRDR